MIQFDYNTFSKVAGKTTLELYEQIKRLLDTVKPSEYNKVFCPEYRNLCLRLLCSINPKDKKDNCCKWRTVSCHILKRINNRNIWVTSNISNNNSASSVPLRLCEKFFFPSPVLVLIHFSNPPFNLRRRLYQPIQISCVTDTQAF